MNESNKKTFKDRLRDVFVPNFSRNYLYLLSLTLLIFLLFNDEFMLAVIVVIAVSLVLLIIIGICGILSIYSAFADRPMGNTVKNMMLSYVIALNFVVAFAAFFSVPDFFQDTLAQKINPALIFPAINILDAFILYFLFKGNVLNEKSIKDDKIGIIELATGSTAVVLIYVIGTSILKFSWPIVFSMCVFYSGHISGIFSDLFFKKQLLPNSVIRPGEMKLILAATIALFIIGIGRTLFFPIAAKMAQNDIKWCAWMPNRFMLDLCYSKNTSLIRDPALCENIIDSFKRDYCVWDVAASLDDPSVCGQISFDTSEYLCRRRFGFIGGWCYSDDGCRNNAKCVNDICQAR